MSRRRRISWLTALGLLLALAGVIGLYSGPEISQYAFPAGGKDPAELLSRAEDKWGNEFPTLSLHGTAEKTSVSTEQAARDELILTETAGGYFEIYPRRFVSGRPLTRGDRGRAVIVLDERLAFGLFGDEDPLGKTVTLAEKKYEVVGVAAQVRRIGDGGACFAWIPLGASGAPAVTVLTLSAGGRAADALRSVFETGAREICGEGQAFFLAKERMRGTILPRAALLLGAVRLLGLCVRLLMKYTRRRAGEIREKLKSRYPRQIAGWLTWQALRTALLWAALGVACAALVVWAAQPMTAFPEWVPDSLVDPEALIRRFRELTAEASRPLRFRTPEMAEILFWSGVLRWGTVLFLTGWVLCPPFGQRKKAGLPKPEAG